MLPSMRADIADLSSCLIVAISGISTTDSAPVRVVGAIRRGIAIPVTRPKVADASLFSMPYFMSRTGITIAVNAPMTPPKTRIAVIGSAGFNAAETSLIRPNLPFFIKNSMKSTTAHVISDTKKPTASPLSGVTAAISPSENISVKVIRRTSSSISVKLNARNDLFPQNQLRITL